MKRLQLAFFITLCSLIPLQATVDATRQHAHEGYFSAYGTVEWGFLAAGIILMAVTWSLGKKRNP